jgi:hypothetical protein
MKKIKQLWIRFKQWIVGNIMFAWQHIKSFFFHIKLWIRNFWFVFFTTKSQFHVFYGYGHYWFAKKYADKRTKISNIQKHAGGGKKHHVLPWGQYSLAVINRLEINEFKSRGILKKGINILTLIEQSYYTTK